MIITCVHDPKYSFNYDPFDKNKEPTNKYISIDYINVLHVIDGIH